MNKTRSLKIDFFKFRLTISKIASKMISIKADLIVLKMIQSFRANYGTCLASYRHLHSIKPICFNERKTSHQINPMTMPACQSRQISVLSCLQYIDNCALTKAIESYLNFLHTSCHLSWWAVVLSFTISAKIVLFFPHVHSLKAVARFRLLIPELERISNEMKTDLAELGKAKKIGYDEAKRKFKSSVCFNSIHSFILDFLILLQF